MSEITRALEVFALFSGVTTIALILTGIYVQLVEWMED